MKIASVIQLQGNFCSCPIFPRSLYCALYARTGVGK